MIKALNLVVLYTRESHALVDFYRALGLEFVEERHERGPIHFAARLGETLFEIYPASGNEAVQTALAFGFAVTDLEQIVRASREAGGQARRIGDHQAIITDPEGRRFFVEVSEGSWSPDPEAP